MMFFLGYFFFFFFFKQKTAYEMSIGDWSSDVCSSDLLHECPPAHFAHETPPSGKALAPQLDSFLLELGLANQNDETKTRFAWLTKAGSLVRESPPPNRLKTPPLARHPQRDDRSKASWSSSDAPQACLPPPPRGQRWRPPREQLLAGA